MRKLKSEPKPKPARKAMYWRCECGTENLAPALQTPDNIVVCEKCHEEAPWGNVSDK